MPIPNGWMLTSCHQLHLQRPLRLSDQCLEFMDFLMLLSQITVHLLWAKSSKHLYARMASSMWLLSRTTSPPCNGQAKRAVQTLKRGLKCTPGNSIQEKLSRFLFDSKITPHTTMGVPPCEMLMNHRLKSSYFGTIPSWDIRESWKSSSQWKQKEPHDQRSLRQFTENDKVCVQDFTTIESQSGFLEQLLKLLVYCPTRSSCTMEQLYEDVLTMFERERTQLSTRI